jgi:tRNA threonylcarbamoyladenosine biosynthesis protein TsaE
MATCISHSPAETQALGEAWGQSVQPGTVIALCGELGAGKTLLVKGLARGLGIPERVQSPTFALVNVYATGRLPLFHLHLYRLETREQIIGAGLDEYLRPVGVTVVEWAERWFAGLPRASAPAPVLANGQLQPPSRPCRLRWVQLETLSDTERRITYEDIGA